MEARGVGAFETLAMEMKAAGTYVARGLSWTDATFDKVVVPLSAALRDAHDRAIDLLKDLRDALVWAGDKKERTGINKMREYWGMHIRFSKEFMVAAKVKRVVELAKEALNEEKAVVIALQTTGAAGLGRVAKSKADEGVACEFDAIESTALQTLLNFIEQFPTERLPPKHQPTRDKIPIPECVQRKQELIARAEALRGALPAAALDALVDGLGGVNKVAELSGRAHRVVKASADDAQGGGTYQYRREKRAEPPAPKRKKQKMDEPPTPDLPKNSRNEVEMKAFMNGTKHVAIITDAASTGISLHAENGCANERQRVHMTIELPWSADKTIQMFGRTHRANQASAPIYKLITTDLSSEKRFLSSVARRLGQLGAVARGDRRAAVGGDWTDVNLIESQYGQAALDDVLQTARLYPDLRRRHGILRNPTIESLVELRLAKGSDVTTFLNRLLGLRVEEQNRGRSRATSTITRTPLFATRPSTPTPVRPHPIPSL